jgi:hypothetical protein
MTGRCLGVLVTSAVIATLGIFSPAHAEFFGCNTPKVRYYSGTPWSYSHAPARQSYAAASYRVSRPVYHATRHTYRTQW